MADTGEGKKEEADYKRLHSFPLIRHTDMPEEMRVEAMELCVTACEKYATNNESAAKMIKETMDKKFGSSWHVVIGWPFGTGHVKDPAPLSQTVTGAKSAFLHFSPTLWDKNMTAELPGCEKKVTT